MHPFCCSSPVPVSRTTAAPPLSPPPSLPPMPPPPTPPPFRSKPELASASANSPQPPTANGFRSASGTHRPRLSADNSNSISNSSHLLDHREVRLKDIVGSGITGILQKWVNYGKGWRRRWFVLQDGVLSYYKIHGPDKIEVNLESEKGSKVIGEESMRRLTRQRNANGHSLTRPKPFGEVHLKVSTIRESRSDDKKFSIFTGTKRLHLRAETMEDRAMWMEALHGCRQ